MYFPWNFKTTQLINVQMIYYNIIYIAPSHWP